MGSTDDRYYLQKEAGNQSIRDTALGGPADLPPATKRRVLVASLLSLTVGNMMINNVVAVLPDFIKGQDWTLGGYQGPPLNENDISLIISIFSIAQIIFAPFNGAIKNMLGSRNSMIVGFAMVTITTFMLGMVQDIHHPKTFMYVACTLRFFQGQGDVLLQITGYSIITSTFRDEITKYISMIEIFVGLGLGMGPLLGTVIYQAFDYKNTMNMFALISLVGTILCGILLPHELNSTYNRDEDEDTDQASAGDGRDALASSDRQQPEALNDITWFTLFSNKSVVFTMIACLAGTFDVVFWIGWMQSQFVADGLDASAFGYAFGVQSCCYLSMCLIFAKYEDRIPRRISFVAGFLGMGFCMLFIGPSLIFDFPSSRILKLICFTMLGAWQVCFFIPVIPEMIERLQVELNIVEGKDPYIDMRLNDQCNDAYGMIFSVVMFAAPLLGSNLYL